MKTMFGRMFSIFAAVLLFGMVLLGAGFRTILRGFLYDQQEKSLRSTAQAVADLTAAYQKAGYMFGLDAAWQLQMDLSLSAEISGADAYICDNSGSIVLCSCGDFSCGHIGMVLDETYLDTVKKEGYYAERGLVSGLYEDDRYVVALPVADNGGVGKLSMVVVTAPIEETAQALRSVTDIFVFTALIVLLIALFAITLFTQNQCRPLKDISIAAREFGHGDLSARVKTGETNTEEVDELAIAFNNMASSLEKSESRRQEFVANVSHELKTPMTTIGGYVDGILDGTIPPDKERHYLQIVSDETKRLSRLVRSMLDISRMQDQGIPEEKKARFDLCEAAGETLVSFEQKINEKKLQVEVQFPEHTVYVRADRDAIGQVIYNLLDNAVKFCQPEGVLGLSIREAGSKAYMSVYNTGDTIPPEEVPLIFDRFHKTDKSRSLNRDGWGLGLYIVKTLVCSHGEDISVTSRDGRTEFTFTMTMDDRVEAAIQSEQEQNESIS